MRLRTQIAIGAALAASAAAPALAQEELDVTDIEVPTIVLEPGAVDTGGEAEDDIDLANIVQSAARAVTTVQEAPAIVTVITAEEIEERHVHLIADALDSVPGYMKVGVLHSMFPHAAPRGQTQAALMLYDGVSGFSPYENVATMNEAQPIELIKRIEVITGPGGVLWGANSLLGIVNIITKDAEDVDGVEAAITGGHGNGNREYLHGYVMYGDDDIADGKGKLLVHGGFKNFLGPGITLPQHLYSAPLPQPNSAMFYGPLTVGHPERSVLFSAFIKATWGKTQLRAYIPYFERHTPAGFPGVVTVANPAQDQLPQCQDVVTDPTMQNVPGDGCPDIGRVARDNAPQFYDRYAVLEHRTRLAGGRAGLSAKVYLTQIVRDFAQLNVLTPIEGVLEGGLSFKADLTTFRYGTAIDGDVELGGNVRLLLGGEAFHETAPNNTDGSPTLQGEGRRADFIAPYDEGRLPLPCPRERDLENGGSRFIENCPLTFAFPASRTVLGAYLAPQWRPTKKLILDAGARIQIAPEQLGTAGHDPTPTFAASAVYNFLPNWHAKANFTQGFRPPVFNNLLSNGEAVQIDGRPDLAVETADAWQGEVNARLFKGQKRIRELNFRLDYSYTRIQNLIQIAGGRYDNTADRGIHSVEFLGKLYVQGGHRFELGYTWLNVATADRGTQRVLPENWFNLLGVFNVVDDKLQASTNLRVMGAYEDANRLVEHRDVHYCTPQEQEMSVCMPGDIVHVANEPWVTTNPTDLVLDRIPPMADLTLGLTWLPTSTLRLDATVWNALNGRYYQPDLFFDYEPRLEMMPNPYEDLRAYLTATYTY